jgi:hypothetical protein
MFSPHALLAQVYTATTIIEAPLTQVINIHSALLVVALVILTSIVIITASKTTHFHHRTNTAKNMLSLKGNPFAKEKAAQPPFLDMNSHYACTTGLRIKSKTNAWEKR